MTKRNVDSTQEKGYVSTRDAIRGLAALPDLTGPDQPHFAVACLGKSLK